MRSNDFKVIGYHNALCEAGAYDIVNQNTSSRGVKGDPNTLFPEIY